MDSVTNLMDNEQDLLEAILIVVKRKNPNPQANLF